MSIRILAEREHDRGVRYDMKIEQQVRVGKAGRRAFFPRHAQEKIEQGINNQHQEGAQKRPLRDIPEDCSEGRDQAKQVA